MPSPGHGMQSLPEDVRVTALVKNLTRRLGLAAFAGQLAWQVVRIDINDPDDCLRLFKSNRDAGLILFAGMLADAWLRAG